MNHTIKIPNRQPGLQQENDPQVLDTIMQQLDFIKTTVEHLTKGMQQVPIMVEMATDVVDDQAQKAHEKGIDLQERKEAVIALLERLSRPETIQKVNSLLDLADQLPNMVVDAVNVVDDTVAAADRQGIDISERIRDVIQLMNRLSSPATIKQINSLLDFAQQGSVMLEFGVDTLDDTMETLHKHGIDVNKAIENAQKMAIAALEALQATLEESPKKIGGLFGLLSQLKDKDFQKVLAFLATFGKYFGQHVGK